MADQPPKPEKTGKEQLAEYGAELARLKQALDLAFGGSGMRLTAPEERVVLPLLISCRDIMEEILFAVNDGFGRAAFRAARTMYECVVTARYLRLHPDRTDAFLNMFNVQWAKIMQNIPSAFRSPEMHNELAAKVPKYAAGIPIGLKDLKWTSDHTLKMAKEAGPLGDLHSLAFDWASCFVHPSSMFVVTTLSQPVAGGQVFQVGVRSQASESIAALRVAHDLLLNALDLRLKYAPSDALQKAFEQCNQDFVKIWEYAPHI